MAITQIDRDFGNAVSIVRIVSTDNVATIGAPNYIFDQAANIRAINGGPFNWLVTDFVVVAAGNGFGLYSISSDFKSLNPVDTFGTGTVTEVDTNNGLTGGPITTTGTIGLAPIASDTVLANIAAGNGVPSATTVTALLDAGIGNTQGDIIYRNATVWTVLGAGTSGQLLQTKGAAANPAYTTSTYPSTNAINTLLYASSANVMAALATANSAILRTDSSGVPGWSGSLTNGQLMIGSTGATPTAAALSAGSGISIVNGAGSITINSTGSGMAVVNVVSGSQAMSSNTRYINSNATQVTYTLPTTSAIGDVIEIVGTLAGNGGWKVTWTTNQYVVYNTNPGTTTTGSLTTTNKYNCLRLVCTVDNLAWVAMGDTGSITVA